MIGNKYMHCVIMNPKQQSLKFAVTVHVWISNRGGALECLEDRTIREGNHELSKCWLAQMEAVCCHSINDDSSLRNENGNINIGSSSHLYSAGLETNLE
ncbi:hypothetical protein Sjap_008549 [Stephania japonica]|uniref:Uncharacterized protein n=1 Tax=Stephania japonica TaxID=461633 RepID=A0AAP0JS00_9MAGN